MNHREQPNFFILGAAKSGTTALHGYLCQHPQIFLSTVKEPHFFDYNAAYALGMDDYIRRHFGNSANYPARGEATPQYFHATDRVPSRIHNAFGETPLKFVIIFRNPVERAWSHYLHRVRNAKEAESFESALEKEEDRLRERPYDWVSYFGDGLYAKQIKAWLEYFDREQFLYLLSEDLYQGYDTAMYNIFTHLGVDSSIEVHPQKRLNVAGEARSYRLMKLLNKHPAFIGPAVQRVFDRPTRLRIRRFMRSLNTTAYKDKPTLSDETRILLTEKYRDDIRELEDLIGRDLSTWLNNPTPSIASSAK